MKKCLIIVNTHKEASQSLGNDIKNYLSEKDIASDIYCFDGFSEDISFENYEFVVTLGGDGTVLFAARGCVKKGIPVFPVNLGEFGFIAGVQPDEWKKEMNRFLEGKAEIAERSMVQATLVNGHDGRNFSGIGLNDVVVCAKTAARTIRFDVFYNEVSLGTFKADGIIVSTATGSTAYSSSAGGPIIDPELDALLLTPVNSFSLSSRPLVLNPHGEIGIKILPSREHDVIITIDGQKPFVLYQDEMIKIRRINQKVRLIGCTSRNFYDALQSKLNWSGGPHA